MYTNMNDEVKAKRLGQYDLLIGAMLLIIGLMMTLAKGDFSVFPESYAQSLPYDSWTIPGSIALIFAALNLVASYFLLHKKTPIERVKKGVIFSMILSVVLLIILLGHAFILKMTFNAFVQIIAVMVFQFFIGFKT